MKLLVAVEILGSILICKSIGPNNKLVDTPSAPLNNPTKNIITLILIKPILVQLNVLGYPFLVTISCSIITLLNANYTIINSIIINIPNIIQLCLSHHSSNPLIIGFVILPLTNDWVTNNTYDIIIIINLLHGIIDLSSSNISLYFNWYSSNSSSPIIWGSFTSSLCKVLSIIWVSVVLYISTSSDSLCCKSIYFLNVNNAIYNITKNKNIINIICGKY